MKILVALSGGVDSSVAACLLTQQGHEVIGVRFTLWQDPLAPALSQVLPTKCCDAQTLMRARSVTDQLKIPYHTVDLQEEFKCAVVDPFLAASRKGLTTNPCVLCNRNFKMHHLLNMAKKFSCDRVATGHYARIIKKCTSATSLPPRGERPSEGSKKRQCHYSLLEAKDRTKDQSYFLSRLTQKELSKTLLPLGNLTKKQTFALAKKFKIPLSRETYRESQDLCFFPEKSPAAFLRRHITNARPGPIKTLDGFVVGTHEGLPFYTVGQRKGLHIGGRKTPVYILRKEQKSNTIFVAPLRETFASDVAIFSLSFTGISLPANVPVSVQVRIRSQGQKVKGIFTRNGTRGHFRSATPLPGITPGQALVLYRGMEILGSGMIAPFSATFIKEFRKKS